MRNGRDVKLSEQGFGLPDVGGSVNMFMQPVQIGIVTKNQVDGLISEDTEWKKTMAVRQPFTSEQLIIRPEGERSWQWYTLHMTLDVVLSTDDIFLMYGLRMRVMEKLDYTEYGYIEYHCIEDYTQA
jgi:hypothetical protein